MNIGERPMVTPLDDLRAIAQRGPTAPMSAPLENVDTQIRMFRSRMKRGQCPECGGSIGGFLPDPECKVCNGHPMPQSLIDQLTRKLNEKYPP